MKVIYIRKKYLYIILAIFIGLIISKFVISSLVIPTYLPIGNKIIGIDPGHGGIDSGASGKSGVSESEINLAIGLKLKRIIEQSGGIVVITRNDNSGLYTEESKTIKEKKSEDLRNRKKIIDKNNCDIFLTIHLNSFPQSKYYGAQTFYKEGCEKSKKLAYIVQDELRNVLDENNKRIPQSKENIYLLREVEVPSILIECGFLSNPDEEKLLQNDKYQEKIAWAIYSGIIRYFNEIENLNVDQ
ncbi:N-acetylmuramoyl-L-alanine amidase CwlD [Anaerosalibacter bizertensis]|uniref:N-acetylmuramoyl-L-alanine amidase CwlD n=1 Tax=Anaerosalibacter bizertensis TaxID=932217 RepID=UPI001D007EEA|nr:N-acetylmuramoyl-L-alanine amidase CwlD [Anaerosalibacter bizertensis]MCB5558944.1 N-acetylmuramoyl-L-alanine amidase CwlD [Anaerosalibacter bizertensis]MCG4586288.1 N-acetylmuramoyl-L-alanine amidase CwlD [Anaerosalibacter bizertensis]